MKKVLLIFTLLGILASSHGAGGGAGGHSSGKSSSQGYAGSTESTKLIREGVPLPLECKISVDKSDDDKVEVELELKWFKDDVPVEDDDRYKIFKENSSLLILSATQEDVGVYRCQTDKFKPAKFFNISVAFLTYRNMAKSTTVLEGDKLYLTCDVDGNPKPIITWLKDGDNVEDSVNSSRFRLNENEKKTENATFLIEEAVYQDRAVYTCVIATGDIQYNTTTFVRIKDMYAALWPFLGICAEVFILCLIIFVYEKRRAKIEFEESDTDQPTDQKNTSDHNKDSVRHRK